MLTSTAAIRALDRKVAAGHLPVLVRGVVTYVMLSEGPRSFVVEQEGAGIFVSVKTAATSGEASPERAFPPLSSGLEVEVRGVTGRGACAPIIVPREVRVLGPGVLPRPRAFSIVDAAAGVLESQRVEVSGVIQDARWVSATGFRCELAVPGQLIGVAVFRPGAWRPEQLIGAVVRLRAVAFSTFNQREEITGLRLRVPAPDDLSIEQPAPADPFAIPVVPLRELQPFSTKGLTLERQRVKGTVTYCRPGEDLFLEEDGRGVRVETTETQPFFPGDLVEASGFIRMRDGVAGLHGALLRKVGNGTPPRPLELAAEQVNAAYGRAPEGVPEIDFNGRVVALRGWVERLEATEGDGCELLIGSGEHLIKTVLAPGGGTGALRALRLGSEVRVSGIGVVQYGMPRSLTELPGPTGLTLLLRTARDVQILRAASWWNPRRLALLLGVTGVILTFALGWIWLLRHRIEQRSALLAEEMRARRDATVEFESTLRERERLAADLHDTLAQGLTGLAFQLEASEALLATAPERSARHLGLARHLLTRSREEVRRSVWGLRSHSLEGRTFAEALRGLAASQAAGRAVQIAVEFQLDEKPVPDLIAGNLLLLAQEAIGNAIRHGEARQIVVRVRIFGRSIEISIKDDGRGFDPAHSGGVKEGHFGLQGMRERIKRLGGTFRVESDEQRGTEIAARVEME